MSEPGLPKRVGWRFTLGAVCLLLVWLGGADLATALRNRAPSPVRIEDLSRWGAPADWLRIEGGVQDLGEAISTSGTLELEALLVPLSAPGATGPARVLVEIRDPEALALFRGLHLEGDTEAQKEAFAREHRAALRFQRPVTGMVARGLVARANRDLLARLAREAGFEVVPDTLFLTEGAAPAPLRGGLFFGLGCLGLVELVRRGLRARREG